MFPIITTHTGPLPTLTLTHPSRTDGRMRLVYSKAEQCTGHGDAAAGFVRAMYLLHAGACTTTSYPWICAVQHVRPVKERLSRVNLVSDRCKRYVSLDVSFSRVSFVDGFPGSTKGMRLFAYQV